MKKDLTVQSSLSSIFWCGRDRHLVDVLVLELTKLGFVVIGLVALLVLSFVGWGYGVVHNGVITGRPMWRVNISNGRTVAKAP